MAETHTKRRLWVSALRIVALVYVAAVAYLVLNERRMVFVGAGTVDARDWLPPRGAGVPWDTVRVVAADEVPVLLLESRLAGGALKPWVMFLHGNGGLLAGGLTRYDLLREAGFNVLAVEFRGYGGSSAAGPPSESGLYADAMAGWSYLTGTLDIDPQQVVVYGWSLGSGLATYVATEANPGGLVTEGAFTSAPDVGADVYPWLPVRLLMRNRFDNLRRGENLSLPWLIFHGRDDAVVPFFHGERLAEATPSARLIPLDAGHNDGVTADRDVVLTELRALIQQLDSSGPVGVGETSGPCRGLDADPWVSGLYGRVLAYDGLAAFATENFGAATGCWGEVTSEYEGAEFGFVDMTFPGGVSLRVETKPPETSIVRLEVMGGFGDEALVIETLRQYCRDAGVSIDWDSPEMSGEGDGKVQTFADPESGLNAMATMTYVEGRLVAVRFSMAL